MAALLGPAAAAGVGTVTKTAVVDMPARAVTSDDAPGHVSGKNRTASDDTAADHADGHVSGKGTESIDD